MRGSDDETAIQENPFFPEVPQLDTVPNDEAAPVAYLHDGLRDFRIETLPFWN
jgi:hypothetical protein